MRNKSGSEYLNGKGVRKTLGKYERWHRGRVEVYQPATKKYVTKSILIASEKLGRPLKDMEVVHHINMNGKDDRAENLFVCNNPNQHLWIHRRAKKIMRLARDAGLVEWSDKDGMARRVRDLVELGILGWDDRGFYRV
jgi:hypothetical protein